jgi:sec-independent protein translocase protein TatA
MELGAPELILILLIIVLLFGVGRISKVGKELGTGIRAFREGLQGDKPTDAPVQVKENVVETIVSEVKGDVADVKNAITETTDTQPRKE